jgi:hypothetical protein
MSGANWSRLGGKRFDFSFIKNAKQEYLIAGVLGVVILGSAYLMIRQFRGPGGTSGPSAFHYKCEKCGNEFTIDVDKLPVVHNMGDERSVMKQDCPKCKAQKSCWREMECPNCHKYFVGESEKAHYDSLARGRGGDMGHAKDICPFCKTDVNEWYRAHPQD